MSSAPSKLQRRAQRTLRIALLWVIAGLLVAFFHWVVLRSVDRNVNYLDLADHHFWRSLAWGLIGGGIYVFLLRDFLRKFPFLQAFGSMSVLVFAVVAAEHAGTTYMDRGGELVGGGGFLGQPSFWAELIHRDVLMGLTMLMVRLNDQFGSGASGFLLGRYFKPRQELRIFMFLDMRSSTAIAEEIGDTRYFQLLNDVYADITDPVVYSEGDIYQYVGDEISVSWQLHKGVKGQRCLRCFFAIRDKLQKRAEHYRQRYGTAPVFKAGFHYGHVTTGEIGLVKKQTIFSGDAVNTAAHIQAACNERGVDNLISKELLDVLVLPADKWTVRFVGDVPLKGKRRTLPLYTVSPNV